MTTQTMGSESISRARSFLAGHARTLDRRRFDFHFAGGAAEPVLDALRGYRNADGGFGYGLEPDLRAPESQPAAALHAFEALAEIAPLGSAEAIDLCDWLDSVTLQDGGLPFALPIEDAAACAPFWASADPRAFSLQITSIVAAYAHRVPATAGHPWLTRATGRCFAAIDELREAPSAYELEFALRLLDATRGHPDVPRLLDRLAAHVPRDGRVRVTGGLPDEALRPLDLAPDPGGPARMLLDESAVVADLERLAAEQKEDGGWTVDFQSYSPAAAGEWRGYATVRALLTLRDNGRL